MGNTYILQIVFRTHFSSIRCVILGLCKFSHGVFSYLMLTLCCICGVWDFDILAFRNSINRERPCTCIVAYGQKAYIRRSIYIYIYTHICINLFANIFIICSKCQTPTPVLRFNKTIHHLFWHLQRAHLPNVLHNFFQSPPHDNPDTHCPSPKKRQTYILTI